MATDDESLPDVERLAAALLAAGAEDVYERIRRAVDRAVCAVATREYSSEVQAADRLGISRTTLRSRRRVAGVEKVDGRATRYEKMPARSGP